MKKILYVVAKDTAETENNTYNGIIEVEGEGAEPIHTAIMDLVQDKVGRDNHDRCSILVQRYQSGGFAVEILDRLQRFEGLVSPESVQSQADESKTVQTEQVAIEQDRTLPSQGELADTIIERMKAVISSGDASNPYSEIELPEEITISLVNDDGTTGYAVKLPKGAHKLAKIVVEAAMEDISIADFAMVFGPKVSISTSEEASET